MLYGLGFVKGSEKYIFVYDDKNRTEILRRMGKFASNPKLSLTWIDASDLSHKIRKQPCDEKRINCCLDIVFDD